MKRHSRARRGPPSDPQKPVWDQAAHTLYWAGKAVKHFRALAKYQETLLTAFQQAGWPPCLPVIALEPFGLKGKHRLQTTVRNLSKNVRPYLHFGLEGNGERVHWKRAKKR